MQGDEVPIRVEAVQLDEPVGVLVARRPEHDEEDVPFVVVDLRPLAEPPRVLERQRVEAELLAQDLEVVRLRRLDVQPEEAAPREQLRDPAALEVQAVGSGAVNDVRRARRIGIGGHRPMVRGRPEAARAGLDGRPAVEDGRLRPWTSTPS